MFLHNVLTMNKFAKLPLYLGLFVFVVAVLFSAIKVGERGNLTNQRSRATTSGASLSLKFTPPDLVSVVLNSEKEVAGVDVVVKFNKEKVAILPSTLRGSTAFSTTGGKVDSTNGTFAFTALAKTAVSSGIISSFNIQATKGNQLLGEINFVGGEGGSAVIDKATSANILTTTTGVNLSSSSK